MNGRKVVIGSLLMGVLFSAGFAQPGNRQLDTKASVLDRLFPIDVTPQPYHLRMVLRFNDPESQLTVVIYPGGRSEAISYTLADMKRGDLERLIEQVETETPEVTVSGLASRVQVNTERSLLDGKLVERALKRLRAIRVSPALPTLTCVDACPRYEYWYDTWQDSVHLSLIGADKGPVAGLVRWMIEFRDNLPNLKQPSSGQAAVGVQRKHDAKTKGFRDLK
jgi:hypothetical protein